MKEKSNTVKLVVAFVVAIVTVVLFIALVWLAYQGYRYYNPPIEMHIWARESDDLYWESVNCTIEGESVFGTSSKVNASIADLSDGIIEADEWVHTYTAPMEVTCKVEIIGDKTVITYEGIATTADGVAENVYKQLVFDFVITETIHDNSVR